MSRHLIRVLALSFLAVACILCPQPNVRPASAGPSPGYVLDWTDEFNGTSLDTTYHWNFYLGPRRSGNNIRDAVSVDSGLLTIKTYTGTDGKHYAGMIATGYDPGRQSSTTDLFTARYGYIEARIDFDGSSGMWNSYFLQSHHAYDLGDPHGNGTEADIIEHRVHDRNNLDISAKAPSALHWGGKSAGGDLHSGNGISLATGFHTYGLEWTPSVQNFYYDSVLVWTVLDVPGDQPHPDSCAFPPCTGENRQSPSVFGPVSHTNQYISLVSELGDSTVDPQPWCGSIPPGGFGSLASSTVKMKVDYVRHYVLAPTAPSSLTATALSSSQIRLTWTDNSYNEFGFKVERSTDGVNFTQIDTVSADGQAYLNTALNSNTRYYYRVRASNFAGNS